MLARMLFYAAQLYGKYKLPVKQYVFYIGSRPARMRRELKQEDLSFQFHVRNVVEVAYYEFCRPANRKKWYWLFWEIWVPIPRKKP